MIEDEKPPLVIVCQGPPACLLEDDETIAAQVAGCVWCKRIVLLPNGEEHVTQPGTA